MNYSELLERNPHWAKTMYENGKLGSELVRKYKYFLELEPTSRENFNDMKEWCRENIGTRNHDWEYIAISTWAFTNEHDMVTFKLRWI